MTDEELIETLRGRNGFGWTEDAADRIEQLSQDYAEACNEAADCYIKQCKAESNLSKALAVLQELVTCVDDGCYCSELKMAAVVDDAIATLAEIKGET
jgi:hypothetical protein